MAKRTATLPLALPPRPTGEPAYRWLYGALREEILAGRLRPGARLPGTRDLAEQHGLARGTIVNAFEQLRSEGYVEGSVGSGTYVSRVLPDDLLEVRRAEGEPPRARRAAPYRLSGYGRRVKPFPSLEDRPARAFRANVPALDLFPTALWAQIASRRLRRASVRLLRGCDPLGDPSLREAVADYLASSRGVRCGPEQVMIVSGVQEAVDLVARLLLDPGDRVCMEDPGYTGAATVFEALGARIATAPVDGEGMVPRPEILQGARLVYLTPAHQFPLGVTLSLPRRLALLDWARGTGGIVLEDDYDGELRYAGRPVPALQGLDAHGRVIFTGSFSKVLFPSLRLGYLVLPPGLAEPFAAAASVTRRHAPLPEQAVLRDFLVEGHFGRHVRRLREVYAERLAVLLEEARRRLGGLLEIPAVEAGLHTVGWLQDGVDAGWAAGAAARRNVDVSPLAEYRREWPLREGLQLGFAAVGPEEIRRGVRELAAVLEPGPKDPRPPGEGFHAPLR